uniref:Uncharacterized protein n=1 Tax=Tanacetum cinerariifolium TaxID=118510 RepID=A0A6L2JPV6_TANCI|nr:hypothetical protein [Tanacetum cinerariifolium]
MIAVQTSGSGNTFLLAVALFFRQWEVLSGSGNFLTSSGNALCILFPTGEVRACLPLPHGLLRYFSRQVLKVGMLISSGITASVPYVSENGVSPLLDLIIVRCAHNTCEISSI